MCADMMYNIKPKDHLCDLQESITWNEGTRCNVAIPGCCRCNDHGTCERCSCTKAGRVCVSCCPLKRGHCSNMRPTTNQHDTKNFQLPEPRAYDLAPTKASFVFTPTSPLHSCWRTSIYLGTTWRYLLHTISDYPLWGRRPLAEKSFYSHSGNIWQAFVDKLARLLRTFTEKTALESCSFIFGCKCHVFASAQEQKRNPVTN